MPQWALQYVQVHCIVGKNCICQKHMTIFWTQWWFGLSHYFASCAKEKLKIHPSWSIKVFMTFYTLDLDLWCENRNVCLRVVLQKRMGTCFLLIFLYYYKSGVKSRSQVTILSAGWSVWKVCTICHSIPVTTLCF